MSVILYPGVRRAEYDLCWEVACSQCDHTQRILPPSLSSSTPAPTYTASGLKLKTQHANPTCPNRLGVWYSNNDTAFVPISFPPYAPHIRHSRSGGTGFHFGHRGTPSQLYLPYCLSLPVSGLTTEGCWKITRPKAHSTYSYSFRSSHTLSHYIGWLWLFFSLCFFKNLWSIYYFLCDRLLLTFITHN